MTTYRCEASFSAYSYAKIMYSIILYAPLGLRIQLLDIKPNFKIVVRQTTKQVLFVSFKILKLNIFMVLVKITVFVSIIIKTNLLLNHYF